MATLHSNKLTGVTLVSNNNDAVSRKYVENVLPSPAGQDGNFLSVSSYDITEQWILRTSGFGSSTIFGITHGNNTYVAGASNGGLNTSTDAIHWELRTSGISSAYAITTIDYINDNFILGSYQAINTSTDGISWTLRTVSNLSSVNEIGFGDGLYIAAGDASRLEVSTDTIHWQRRTSGFTYKHTSVTYANNTYVLVGDYLNVATSTDTIVWTMRTVPYYTNAGNASDWHDVEYMNSKFYITGQVYNNGYFYGTATSTDAITWEQDTTVINNNVIRNFEYFSDIGYYFATLQYGVLVSTDTLVWTLRSFGGSTTFYDITYGSNDDTLAISGTSGTIATSFGRIKEWGDTTSTSSLADKNSPRGYQEFTTPGTYTFFVPPLASQFYIEVIGGGSGGSSGNPYNLSGNNPYSGAGGGSGAYSSWLISKEELDGATTMTANVGSGGSGGNNLGVSVSDDGISWTPEFQGIENSYPFYGSASGKDASLNDVYLLTTYNGIVVSSIGGTNKWTRRTVGLTSGYLYNATYANGIFLAGGTTTPKLIASTDTIHWTARTAGVTSQSLYDVTYLNNTYFVAGDSGMLSSSTDSITWTLRTWGFTNVVYDMAYGNGNYLIAAQGIISSSTDSIHWARRTNAVNNSPYTCEFGNGYFVVGHQYGDLTASTDTIHWQSRTTGVFPTNSPSNNIIPFDGIAFGDGKFVAAARHYPDQTHSIITSTDSIQWTLRTGLNGTGSNAQVYSVSYGLKFMIANGYSQQGTSGGTSSVYVGGSLGLIGQAAGAPSSTTGGSGASLPGSYLTLSGYAGQQGANASTGLRSGLSPTPLTTFGISGGGSGANGSFSGGSVETNIYGTTSTASGGYIPSSTEILTSWTLRTSGFGAGDIISFTFGNGIYVAGGGSGILNTSTDAITWTLRTSGFAALAIRSLIYENNTYVAGGDFGTLTTSTDSIVWTYRTSSFASLSIFALTYGNNTYVAGGDGGRLTTSTDSIVWTLRTSGFSTGDINALTYANSTYVIVGQTGRLNTSTDAITWTLRTSGFGANEINALTYGNNTYVAGGAGGGRLTTSTDAITWTLRSASFGVDINALTYGNNTYLAGGGNYSVSSRLNTSTDAIHWTLRTSGFGDTKTIYALTFSNSNNTYLVGGLSGNLSSTLSYNPNGSDGADPSFSGSYGSGGGGGGALSSGLSSWYSRTAIFSYTSNGANEDYISALGYGNGIYLASAYFGPSAYKLVTSTDSITWQLRTRAEEIYPYDISYYGGNYFTTNTSGRMEVSTDSIHWQLRTTGTTQGLFSPVVYDGTGTYVSGGNGGTIITSTDTIHWTLRTTGVGGTDIRGLAYGSGNFIAAGNSASYSLFASTDAIHWILRTTGYGSQSSYNVAYENSIYFTWPSSTSLAVSTDTISWTLRTRGIGNTLYSISYGNDIYVAGYSGGYIQTSTDNIVWTKRYTENLRDVYKTTFGNGIHLVSGRGGINSYSLISEFAAGNGGNGTRGGGGGGGGHSPEGGKFGLGGKGGDGYVRITWW